MLRVLLGLFVVAHGLVTFGIWAAPVTDKAPFNPSHSWLLGNARTLAVPWQWPRQSPSGPPEAASSPSTIGGPLPRSRQERQQSC
jgi:hypothetical protein